MAAVNLRRHVWILLDSAVREMWILALNGLMLLGAWILRKKWQRPHGLLTIAAWVGMLLCVPVAPPWDAEHLRAYAATPPFVIAFPLMGLAYRRRESCEGDHETQQGWLLPAEASAPLTEGVARLAASHALRREIGAAGQTRILEQFDIHRVGAKYLSLYEELQ